ncbi:MAG: hypothetical protein ABIH23_03745, partial [bacterium]
NTGTRNRCGGIWNRNMSGTSNLKFLAEKVLQRNAQWNKTGTGNEITKEKRNEGRNDAQDESVFPILGISAQSGPNKTKEPAELPEECAVFVVGACGQRFAVLRLYAERVCEICGKCEQVH